MFDSQSSDISPDQSVSQRDALDTVNDFEREIYGTPPASSVVADMDLDPTKPPTRRLKHILVEEDNLQSKAMAKQLLEKYKVNLSFLFELILGQGGENS
jgi:hypothetical protein